MMLEDPKRSLRALGGTGDMSYSGYLIGVSCRWLLLYLLVLVVRQPIRAEQIVWGWGFQ